MFKSAAIVLAVSTFVLPAAAQAGTAITGTGVEATLGSPGGAGSAFEAGASTGDGKFRSASGMLGVDEKRLGAGGLAVGDDASVAFLAGTLIGADTAFVGTVDAEVKARVGFVEPAKPDNGMPVNGKFSFRTIASRLPEPATWGLMILGFGAIGGVMRYKIRKAEARFTAKLRRIAAGEDDQRA